MAEISTDNFLEISMVNGNIRTIRMNRPAKKNALNESLFRGLAKAFVDARNDDATHIIVWTGTGDYFCAGADLMEGLAFSNDALFKWLTKAFIDCTKPIVVVVNGPSIGIGVTLLGLCDTIYSSDLATFSTPFSQLGVCVEGCSSYTFPRIMGYAKANDMLLFGSKFTAAQAHACGLITQVFPHDKLQEEAWAQIRRMAQLPIQSLLHTKELIRGPHREILHQVNEAEAEKVLELAAIIKKNLGG